MLFKDLQAERDVLYQLAPRRVGETNTGQFQRFDLPKVVKNGSSDEPIQVEAGIVRGQCRGEVTKGKDVLQQTSPERVMDFHRRRRCFEPRADGYVGDDRLQKLSKGLVAHHRDKRLQLAEHFLGIAD